MNRTDELRQQIDACRAGSDDLHRLELADLRRALAAAPPGHGGDADRAVAGELERAQRFDRSVVSALHDVAVPAGLLEKLLAQSAQAGGNEATGDEASGDEASGNESGQELSAAAAATDAENLAPVGEPAASPLARQPRRLTRRTLALAGGGLIAAGLLALGYFQWSLAPRRISHDELVAEVTQWIAKPLRSPGWRPGTPPKVLSDRFPTTDLRFSVAGWKQIETSRGEPTAVYELAPVGNGAAAWLVVVDTPHQYPVATSPLSQLPGISGGYSAGAWQRSGGPLFILVVSRGGRPLRNYLRMTRAA